MAFRLKRISSSILWNGTLSSLSFFIHSGQVLPFTLLSITAWYSAPHTLQCHQTFSLDFDHTSVGFFVFLSDHSDASSGYSVAKSFIPCTSLSPAHTGQPCPSVLSAILDLHVWPQRRHFHVISLSAFLETISGINGILLASHSSTSSGWRVAKSLTPFRTLFPEQ